MRIVVAFVLVLAVARGAHADGDNPQPPPKPYRSMIMAMDAGAAVFWLGGSALTYRARNCECEDFSFELAGIGALMYASWGAFAHHEAGHDGRAVASVALRIALPIATGLLAHQAGTRGWETILAVGGGMVGAMAIDWFALATTF